MTIDSDKLVNASLDRCEDILQILDDTFSDTPEEKRFRHAERRYNDLIRDGRPDSYKIATTYLEWCLTHPRRIGGMPKLLDCLCEHGWILEQEDPERWRPCPKCLPGAHDKWMGHANNDEEDLFDGSAI